MITWKKGFTIPELLIVLALFGLLLALGAWSVSSARARVRDAQRVSDVALLRQSLQQYFLQASTYPVSTGVNLGQPGANADRLAGAGFVGMNDISTPVYLSKIPVGPGTNEFYRYHGGANGYSLRFQTESDTDIGKANVYYAHATTIDQTDTEK